MAKGALSAFVNEYFFNTAATIQNYHDSYTLTRWHAIQELWHNKIIMLLEASCVIGIVYSFSQLKSIRYGILFFSVIFITIHFIGMHFSYYPYAILAILLMPFSIAVSHVIKKIIHSKIYIPLITLFVIIAINIINYHNESPNHLRPYNAFMEMTQFISEKQFSNVLYFNTCPEGEGMLAESKPPCRYWSSQLGATGEMLKDQEEAIKHHKADFVITDVVDGPSLAFYSTFARRDSLLLASGYVRKELNTSNEKVALYYRPSIHIPE